MKINLHTNELRPTTLAAIVADMIGMIGADYAKHYRDNYNALIDSYNALVINAGAEDTEKMLIAEGADMDAFDALRASL